MAGEPNICVDGCDEWIRIVTGDIDHKISFDNGLRIESIKELQDLIAGLKAEFN